MNTNGITRYSNAREHPDIKSRTIKKDKESSPIVTYILLTLWVVSLIVLIVLIVLIDWFDCIDIIDYFDCIAWY